MSPAAVLIVVVTVGTKVAAMVAWAADVMMTFTLHGIIGKLLIILRHLISTLPPGPGPSDINNYS